YLVDLVEATLNRTEGIVEVPPAPDHTGLWRGPRPELRATRTGSQISGGLGSCDPFDLPANIYLSMQRGPEERHRSKTRHRQVMALGRRVIGVKDDAAIIQGFTQYRAG